MFALSLLCIRKTPLFWVYPPAKSTKGALSIDGANLCYSLGPLGESGKHLLSKSKSIIYQKHEGTKWRISDHWLPNYTYEDEVMVDLHSSIKCFPPLPNGTNA